MAKKKDFDGIVEQSFYEGYHSEPGSLSDNSNLDSVLAGRLLYRRALRISTATAAKLVQSANTDAERDFYRCLYTMALKREQK